RQAQPPGGVGKQRPVGWVDVGRDVPGSAHRRHRPDVVDVAMGEQDRDRLEPVLGEDLRDARLGVLAWVDDHALLPPAGRHHIAVGGERAGREPGDEHGAILPWGSTMVRRALLVQATDLSPTRRTDNRAVATSNVQVRFAKFRRSAWWHPTGEEENGRGGEEGTPAQ